MKKLTIAMLIMIMCVAFVGCGDSGNTEEATETTAAAEPAYEDYSFVEELSNGTGYDMGVTSVGLSTEGEVVMRTEGDLAAAVGDQLVITDGVKELYVEPYGNGGFYSILMIREDGTVSVVNTTKLRDEKTIEILDNIADLQDIVSIEGTIEDDAYVIYAINSNDERIMLDPYLQ